MSRAPINEAVALLRNHATEDIERLQSELLMRNPDRAPQLLELLQPGELLGEEEDDMLVPRAEICVRAVSKARELCDRSALAILSRLRMAKRARFIGELAAAIGSASVLGTLPVQKATLTVISGVIALFGALGSLVSQHILEPLNGSRGGMGERFTKLIELRFNAARVQAELELHLKAASSPKGVGRLAALVGEGNSICHDINAYGDEFLIPAP